MAAALALAAMTCLAGRDALAGQTRRVANKLQDGQRLAGVVAALWPVRLDELTEQASGGSSWPEADRHFVWMRALLAAGRQVAIEGGRQDAGTGHSTGGTAAPAADRAMDAAASGLSDPRNGEADAALQCGLDKKAGLAWPAKGRLAAGFESGRDARQGIALATADGEPVLAAADGRVVFAGMLRGLGRTVIVAHGLHCHTVYACLADATVAAGESVTRKSVLGRAGFCPPAGETGVYFELRFREKALNPAEWFAANPSRDVSGER